MLHFLFPLRPWHLATLVVLASVVLNLFLYGSDVATPETLTLLSDAKGYDNAGRALLFGSEAKNGLVSLRGYLYPIFAVGLSALSPFLLLGVQTLAIGVGVWCIAASERELTDKIRFTPLVLLSVSLLLAPALMMTEALAFLFGAAALRAFTRPDGQGLGVTCLALAALIKPAFFPILLVSLVTLRFRWQSIGVTTLLVCLFGAQFLLSSSFDGKPVLTSAGNSNFTQRFYPAVVGYSEGQGFVSYKSELAEAVRTARPERAEQMRYVLSKPFAAIEAWGKILWHYHLMEPSGYANDIDRPLSGTLADLSHGLNLLLVLTGFVGVMGSLVFLRRYSWRFWPAALIAPSLLATAPLVYWQGDRIVFPALLMLLPFAGLFLSAARRPRPKSSPNTLT